MKSVNILFYLAFFCLTFTNAQTADEIIDKYVETIGGQEAWNNVNSLTISGLAKQGGSDFPFKFIILKDGRSVIYVDMPGQTIVYEAFDGETLWETNMQNMHAEARPQEESDNYKCSAKDFLLNGLLDYKAKGYKAEFIEKTEFEGTECYKIKLTKKPLTVENKKVDDIHYFYIDTESQVPIASETTVGYGEAKGAKEETIMSDYQEVKEGVFMPFTTIEKYNGQTALQLFYKTVTINETVDESIFKMPKQ